MQFFSDVRGKKEYRERIYNISLSKKYIRRKVFEKTAYQL